jgi:hypothetical protein
MIRIFIYVFLLLTTVANAVDEIKRVENVMDDLSTMRQQYEQKLADEQEKNHIIQKKLNLALEAIESLRNQLESKKECVAKQKKYTLLKGRKAPQEKSLAKKRSLNKPTKVLKKYNRSQIEYFEAAPFRLKQNADIYSDINSSTKIASWEKGRSFTSNQKRAGWVKITGYFVDRVWQKAPQDMWIKEDDVFKRSR